MTVLRACVRCGKPSSESYCPEHKPVPWATSTRRQRVKLSGSAEQARAKCILERFLYACHWCGNGGADEVDHVVALGEGGSDEESNLAPIHAECHRQKTQEEAQRARERRGGPYSWPTDSAPRSAVIGSA
jgi:5-methylcytosine-specific restriction enzyme A